MDLGTQTLLSIAALLALNTAMVRLRMLQDRSVLFWGVQGLNVAVALWVAWRGIHGFEHIPIVPWVLALWLMLRVALNHRWRMARGRSEARSEGAELRASAIRAALVDEPRQPDEPSAPVSSSDS